MCVQTVWGPKAEQPRALGPSAACWPLSHQKVPGNQELKQQVGPRAPARRALCSSVRRVSEPGGPPDPVSRASQRAACPSLPKKTRTRDSRLPHGSTDSPHDRLLSGFDENIGPHPGSLQPGVISMWTRLTSQMLELPDVPQGLAGCRQRGGVPRPWRWPTGL